MCRTSVSLPVARPLCGFDPSIHWKPGDMPPSRLWELWPGGRVWGFVVSFRAATMIDTWHKTMGSWRRRRDEEGG